MHRVRNLFFLFLITLFCTTNASAVSGGLGIHAATHFGLGRISSEDNVAILPRTMDSWNIEAMPGYRYGPIMLGPLIDYNMVGQITTQSLVGSALGGTQFLIGLGLELEFGEFKLLGSYDFIGDYSISSSNTNGVSEDYESPTGYHLLIGYAITSQWYWDVEYTAVSYSTFNTNGTLTDIGGNPMKRWNIAAGISFSY